MVDYPPSNRLHKRPLCGEMEFPPEWFAFASIQFIWNFQSWLLNETQWRSEKGEKQINRSELWQCKIKRRRRPTPFDYWRIIIAHQSLILFLYSRDYSPRHRQGSNNKHQILRQFKWIKPYVQSIELMYVLISCHRLMSWRNALFTNFHHDDRRSDVMVEINPIPNRMKQIPEARGNKLSHPDEYVSPLSAFFLQQYEFETPKAKRTNEGSQMILNDPQQWQTEYSNQKERGVTRKGGERRRERGRRGGRGREGRRRKRERVLLQLSKEEKSSSNWHSKSKGFTPNMNCRIKDFSDPSPPPPPLLPPPLPPLLLFLLLRLFSSPLFV